MGLGVEFETGKIFDAVLMFGKVDGLPEPMARFTEAVVESLTEFDGQILTAELGERVNRRILSMQIIASEII